MLNIINMIDKAWENNTNKDNDDKWIQHIYNNKFYYFISYDIK